MERLRAWLRGLLELNGTPRGIAGGFALGVGLSLIPVPFLGMVLVALSTAFARQVGDEWDQRLPETGALLAAAVADERAGIAQAVPSLAGWMTDPSRFPTRWIAAVQATLDQARERAR